MADKESEIKLKEKKKRKKSKQAESDKETANSKVKRTKVSEINESKLCANHKINIPSLKNGKRKSKVIVSEQKSQTTNVEDVANNSKKVEPFSGQWAEANVGSDERKDKFLRLLGGYKSSNIENKKDERFSSFAFSKKKEENYNEKLAKQYDNAWEITRQKRGLGLGFEANKDKEEKPSFSWE